MGTGDISCSDGSCLPSHEYIDMCCIRSYPFCKQWRDISISGSDYRFGECSGSHQICGQHTAKSRGEKQIKDRTFACFLSAEHGLIAYVEKMLDWFNGVRILVTRHAQCSSKPVFGFSVQEICPIWKLVFYQLVLMKFT